MVMWCLLWWRQDNETITSRLLLCLHLIICATFCTKFPDRPPTLTKKNKITLHLSFHYHIQISTKVYKIPFFNIKPCAFLTHKMICLNLVKSPPNNMPSMTQWMNLKRNLYLVKSLVPESLKLHKGKRAGLILSLTPSSAMFA